MENDLAVSGRLKDGTFPLKLVAQNVSINQITIVSDGHLAAHTIDHKGLRVFGRT